MTFSDSLEVAIGLAFVFMLMSLVLTAFNEALELWLKSRGKNLLRGIAELIGGNRLAGQRPRRTRRWRYTARP